MQPKLVLFDVDGTLVDTAGAGRRAMERAFHGVFGVDGFERAARVAFAGRTDPVILESTAEAIGIEPHEFRRRRVELEACFVREIEAEMRRPDDRRRVLPGVPGLLEALETMDGVSVDTAELALVPKTMTELEDSKAKQTLRLLEALEDLDDVQKVFSNADFSDEVLAEFAEA